MSDMDIIHLGGDTEEVEVESFISEDGKTLTVDAVEEAVDAVQDFIREKLTACGCDKKPMMQIRLAVEEIFVNIISYAYKPGKGMAEVYCDVDEDKIVTIRFSDSGKKFDPLSLDEIDTPSEVFIQQVGGFGIHIVKKVMNTVDYEYKDEKNVLTITKDLK